MAITNADLPAGFKMYGKQTAPGFYNRDAANASPIAAGDLVIIDDDGNINAADAGELLLGVADDFATGSAAKTQIAVYDDPDQKFLGQDDASGAPAQTDIGLNADHIDTAANVVLKQSRQEIDHSTISTATYGLRLLDVVRSPAHAIGDNAEWVVRINEHTYASAVGL